MMEWNRNTRGEEHDARRAITLDRAILLEGHALEEDGMVSGRKEVQHTPGPWFAIEGGDGRVLDANGEMVCDCLTHGTDEAAAANARLIAAAPMLLGVVESLIEWATMTKEEVREADRRASEATDGNMNHFDGIIESARAAAKEAR